MGAGRPGGDRPQTGKPLDGKCCRWQQIHEVLYSELGPSQSILLFVCYEIGQIFCGFEKYHFFLN
jgi:hypothetical protein